ncbi:MAG: MBL fold metallo-hydrolase, partial [Chloroflexota bacterium]
MLKALSQILTRVPRKRLAAPLVVIAILVWSIALTMPDDKVHVSFLDVGQGDAILIAQGSQQILVDGGPGSQAITRELSEKMPFRDRSIDLIILTHPHEDHLAGLVEVPFRYSLGQAAQSTASHSGSLYDEWRKALEAQGIAPTIIQPGQEVRLGDGLVITILHPEPDTDKTLDANGKSLVLRVEVGKVSFLLTSDIGQKAESMLLQQRARVASTVLKVAHHGSGGSNSAPFITT